jgi:hypothetical protein
MLFSKQNKKYRLSEMSEKIYVFKQRKEIFWLASHTVLIFIPYSEK